MNRFVVWLVLSTLLLVTETNFAAVYEYSPDPGSSAIIGETDLDAFATDQASLSDIDLCLPAGITSSIVNVFIAQPSVEYVFKESSRSRRTPPFLPPPIR